MAFTNLFLLPFSPFTLPKRPLQKALQKELFPSFLCWGLALRSFSLASRPLSTKVAQCWAPQRITNLLPKPLTILYTECVHKTGMSFLYLESCCKNHTIRNIKLQIASTSLGSSTSGFELQIHKAQSTPQLPDTQINLK